MHRFNGQVRNDLDEGIEGVELHDQEGEYLATTDSCGDYKFQYGDTELSVTFSHEESIEKIADVYYEQTDTVYLRGLEDSFDGLSDLAIKCLSQLYDKIESANMIVESTALKAIVNESQEIIEVVKDRIGKLQDMVTYEDEE